MSSEHKLSETLAYYWWRVKVLLCYFKHDWRILYTRFVCGGEDDGLYSGKKMCERCYAIEYFSGRHK